MAAPDRGTERPPKSIADVLQKYREDLKNKRDNNYQTICGLHDLVKKGKVETTEGRKMIMEMRKSETLHHFPQELQQWLTAYEDQKNLKRKQGHEKAAESKGTSPVPPSAKHFSGNENDAVDSGPADAPTKSDPSPEVVNKAKDEKDSKILILQEQIEKLKTELETEKKTAKEKSHIFDDRGKQIKELEKVISEKDEQLKVSGDEAEHLSKRLKEEIMKRTNVERDLKEKEKIAMGLEKQANDNYTDNQQLKANLKELDSAYRTLAKEKKQVEQHAKNMEGYFKDEKRKSDDEYKKLLAERDDLRDRFSKLAGKKLQEQNADIADLSDPNRAMKLSEKFGQLYDDEWTNAFESLTDKKSGLPLKDAINVLLRLLQECWTFCNKLMATQMESLHSVFLHPAQNLANFDQKKTGLTDRPRITSKDQPSLNDLRKRVGVSPSVIEEVKQALLADSKTWDKREKKEFDRKHIEACTPYINKCAEVCWLMALHDPPLVMKMDVKPGEKFDTNIYTVYSQSGQSIDFLVWPPLYNGKDGGLLSKGVAEPLRVVGKKK